MREKRKLRIYTTAQHKTRLGYFSPRHIAGRELYIYLWEPVEADLPMSTIKGDLT